MKSTEQQVREYILEPMLEVYSAPRGIDPQKALKQYMDAMRPYPPEALQGGWIGLRNSREHSTWPTIGELTTAVRDWVHKNVKSDPAKPARVDGHHDRRSYTHLCPDWMRSDLGQQALREGWARILWDEIEIKGQLEKSASWMRDLDREMREKIAEMQAKPHEYMPAITQMGLNRLAKEAELMSKYL